MARPKAYAEGSTVKVGTQIPTEVDAAIDSLVALSGGISKATFIRQALLAGLQPYALVSPELADALAATSTVTRKPA
jgi:hypothetical protein